MSCNLIIIPTEQGVGSSGVKSGIKHALEQQGYTVDIFHPFKDSNLSNIELQKFFIGNHQQDLLETIIQAFDYKKSNNDFILIDGIYNKINPNDELAWFAPHVSWFNNALTRALMGYVILVTRPLNNNILSLEENINLALNEISKDFILGVVVAKLGAPIDQNGKISFSFLDEDNSTTLEITKDDILNSPYFIKNKLNLIGTTRWNNEMMHPRVSDLMKQLNIEPLMQNTEEYRRVKRISLCSRGINNIFEDLKTGTLLITAMDRADVIVAASLAESKGIKLAGLLLTANYDVPHRTLNFCYNDKINSLPIYANQDSRKTMSIILAIKDLEITKVPADDEERIKLIATEIAESIDINILEQKLNKQVSKKMSPAAFRYMLIKKAKESKKRIVLPEGEEPRTLQAAIHCHKKEIAECVLIGNPDKISQLAISFGLELPSDMKIINPEFAAGQYANTLVELRKSKGVTYEQAMDTLIKDVNYLGTMMIHNNEVDGLVSGAENTTAATVRPALQIIKTKPGSKLVSSVFFMCMEEQVLVYGDCAINPDPNAEQLADIAIQSADTALQFNIEPRVAMISYSTGNSGTGADVEKVKAATALVKKLRPDIIIDGPLQYDAAMIKEVADKKAPNSPVAGKATVCIFPDLNTGNTTYKAVQRSANVLSVGPLLQGLNKPVNDLSRGATIDDIIYTIAITAIQS